MKNYKNIREVPKDQLKLIRIDLVERLCSLEKEVDSLQVSNHRIAELRRQQDSYATAFNITLRLERNESDDHIRKKEALGFDGLNIFYKTLLETYNSLQST
ncbi:hypothetical protein J4455_02290 [Candidatus Woesearchaeota archaeon]|nr:hypothetical protein [Candidatus Woesearchaeota archaeon]